MVKKFAALAAGVAMLSLGIMPVFAQTTDSDTATTEVNLNDTMSLTVSAGASPFGTGGSATAFTPTSSSVSTKNLAATKTTLTMLTNSQEGGTISADGTGNSGVLTGGTGGTDQIPNTGAGASFAVACVAGQSTANGFTGLAARVFNTGTDADFVYSGAATTIATKYGDGTDAANSNWCHFDATDREVARTQVYNELATDLIIDYVIGVKAGEQTAGLYAETITYTGTAN